MMELSSKKKKLLEKVFSKPTPANLVWREVESLILSLGITITEAGGSVIILRYAGHKLVVHRPHPQKEAYRAMIDRLRHFLLEVGIRP